MAENSTDEVTADAEEADSNNGPMIAIIVGVLLFLPLAVSLFYQLYNH